MPSTVHLRQVARRRNPSHVLGRRSAGSERIAGLVLLLAADLVAAILLGGFSAWHMRMALRNQTTVSALVIVPTQCTRDAQAASMRTYARALWPSVHPSLQAWLNDANNQFGNPAHLTRSPLAPQLHPPGESVYDVGAAANWRTVFGSRWHLWPLPLWLDDEPEGDGLHFPTVNTHDHAA